MANLLNVDKPRSNAGPLPANTVAPMLIRIKRSPDGDILTPSSSSEALYLNCEIRVMGGPFKGEAFYPKLTVEGPEPGHEAAKQISYALIGSIVRSACRLALDDMGPEAQTKLNDFNFEDLHDARFIGKTGKIERGKLRDPSMGPHGDRYDDKTTLACGVTPDMAKEWGEWKNTPRGLHLDDGLDGALASTGSTPAQASPIDPPPWAE
jgi:hypothetical protein